MTEQAWLIERSGEYWAAGPFSSWQESQALDPDLWRKSWTKDANAALRFARKQDAEMVIRYEGWQHAVATEHMWIDAALAHGEKADKTK